MAKAYELVLEMSDILRNSVYERKIMFETLVTNGLKRGFTGTETLSVRNVEWTNISFDWLNNPNPEKDLSRSAKLMVLEHIIPELKMYNMLWHFPVTRNTTDNGSLKELVDNDVIFRTEVAGIYLVNPLKVWRGNPILAVEETKEMLRIHKKPSLDLIKDRRPADKYTHATAAEMFKLNGGDIDITNQQTDNI
jgi:hypothetical protein